MSDSNDTGIRWEEPPARPENSRGKGRWFRIVAQLKERPMTWAVVAEDTYSSTASNLKKGTYGGTQAGEIETRFKANPGSIRGTVYARWVGETE